MQNLSRELHAAQFLSLEVSAVILVFGIVLYPLGSAGQIVEIKPHILTDTSVVRDQFKAIINDVRVNTDEREFEKIMGYEMVLYKKDIQTGSSGREDFFVSSFATASYHYSITYSRFNNNGDKSFKTTAIFMPSDGVSLDEIGCLSLEDIKTYGERSGWRIERPFVDWAKHGLIATKGRLRFVAEARLGIGERRVSSKEADDWIAKYGTRGCVEKIDITTNQ